MRTAGEQEMDWSSQFALVLSGAISFRITCRRRAEGVLTGPRQEHLEYGTELLSKLKRSGDHVILGGDANSPPGAQMRD